MLVDDGAADVAVTTDVDALVQDAGFDLGVAVYAHARAKDAAIDVAARDDAALADQRVGGKADAAVGAGALFVEDKLGRWQRAHPGVDRPARVIKAKHRHHLHQIHVGQVVLRDGADVAPVAALTLVHAGDLVAHEVVGVQGALTHHVGQDVAAKVVLGAQLAFGVG